MAITVKCGNCGFTRQLHDSLAGRKGKCSCGAILTIPKPAPVAATQASADAPAWTDPIDDVKEFANNEHELEVVDPPAAPPPPPAYAPPMACCAGCRGMFAPHLVYATPQGPLCPDCMAASRNTRKKTQAPQFWRATTPKTAPSARSGLSGSALGHIAIGGVLCGGGALATWASYNSASGGGRYTVFYGAIIWGAIHLVRGLCALIAGG